MRDLKRKVLLIADRDPHVVSLLGDLLITSNYELIHVSDGQAALSILKDRRVSIAVVELELPVVNGLDLIGRLTAQKKKPEQIIATTFLEHEPLFEVAKLLGADAIVRKPVKKETLPEVARLVGT